MAVPTRSSQNNRGSVRDRVPEPSESADFDRISWRVSDAEMNTSSWVGLRRDMSLGMRGVRSLKQLSLRITIVLKKAHIPSRKDSHPRLKTTEGRLGLISGGSGLN
jgi:hypothetical protein